MKERERVRVKERERDFDIARKEWIRLERSSDFDCIKTVMGVGRRLDWQVTRDGTVYEEVFMTTIFLPNLM